MNLDGLGRYRTFSFNTFTLRLLLEVPQVGTSRRSQSGLDGSGPGSFLSVWIDFHSIFCHLLTETKKQASGLMRRETYTRRLAVFTFRALLRFFCHSFLGHVEHGRNIEKVPCKIGTQAQRNGLPGNGIRELFSQWRMDPRAMSNVQICLRLF